MVNVLNMFYFGYFMVLQGWRGLVTGVGGVVCVLSPVF